MIGRGHACASSDASGRCGSPFSCCVAACQRGTPPDLVRVELPELVTSPDPVRVSVSVRRGGSSAAAKEPVSYSVSPPELAALTKEGTLTCGKSGDGQVTADVLGVKGTAALRCRLVERIEVGEMPPMEVKAPPARAQARRVLRQGVRS